MIKTDWIKHLHAFRKRELEIAFSEIGRKFSKGLELGAGDGYQSQLLSNHVDELIATDLNEDRLPNMSNTSNIKFLVCDAEKVGTVFEESSFDLVFSSNLMEHLPDVNSCFNGIHKVLKDDGIVIHIMPSPSWRFFATCLHIPNKMVNIIERVIFKKGTHLSKGNNLKTKTKQRSSLFRLLVPKPHGVSKNFITELWDFRKGRWQREFHLTGFEIIVIKKGPVSSGYGFGLDKLRRILENIGVATELIYIARKK